MRKKHDDLDKYEEEILEDFENDNFKSVKNVKEEMKLAKQASHNFMKRDSRIKK